MGTSEPRTVTPFAFINGSQMRPDGDWRPSIAKMDHPSAQRDLEMGAETHESVPGSGETNSEVLQGPGFSLQASVDELITEMLT